MTESTTKAIDSPETMSAEAHAPNDTPKDINRGGAPQGNRNRERHGLRASKLPADCKYIENSTNKLRRELEAAIGETTIIESALINSATRHERRAQLAERWIRINGDSLSLSDYLSMLSTISSATDARDRAIEKLNIGKADSDPWSTLNAPPALMDHSKPPESEAEDCQSRDGNAESDNH